MAEWQSGYAAACKAVDLGSIPGSASISFIIKIHPRHLIHRASERYKVLPNLK